MVDCWWMIFSITFMPIERAHKTKLCGVNAKAQHRGPHADDVIWCFIIIMKPLETETTLQRGQNPIHFQALLNKHASFTTSLSVFFFTAPEPHLRFRTLFRRNRNLARTHARTRVMSFASNKRERHSGKALQLGNQGWITDCRQSLAVGCHWLPLITGTCR